MPGPGAGVELSGSGRLLLVVHCGPYRVDYVVFSDDIGRTWSVIPRGFPSMDEATMADLGNGNVILNMRHRREASLGRAVARSSDGGYTWTAVGYDAALVGHICQASLTAFRSHLFFSNPTSKGRGFLTVKRSTDGGHKWSSMLLIQRHSTFGYSSIVQGVIPPGSSQLGILFESSLKGSPSTISFCTFPVDF